MADEVKSQRISSNKQRKEVRLDGRRKIIYQNNIYGYAKRNAPQCNAMQCKENLNR